MKVGTIYLLALVLFSCTKDKDNSTTDLLVRYKWYPFEVNTSIQYDGENNSTAIQTIQMDSCTQKSFYSFNNDGKVTRQLPCRNSQASGTWTLSADSIFYVSIPYESSNVGFISVNGPLKLMAIDNNEMKTIYGTKILSYSNGVSKTGTEFYITTYKHY